MRFFKKFLPRFFESRNLAFSDMYQTKTNAPVYTDWTIRKAVSEGYKYNGWVYRSVYLIQKAAASVPWFVYREGEKLDLHHLSQLFQRPNPHISRQDMFELIVMWLELTGNSYLKKVMASGRTSELWPISPDRIAPIPSKSIDDWVKGYALDQKKTVSFKPEEIIHHLFMDPSNPLLGISPLQAAGKVVDADNDQLTWNKSSMENRGVIDGVFTFEREFESIDDASDIADKLNERYGGPKNANRIAVVGGNAKYHRTAMTPVEADYSNSRRANRDEIFIIFGVPPQLAGAQESATYNNFATSTLIFWASTIIPLLDDIKDTFNFSFDGELNDGEQIRYDLSNVAAIKEATFNKIESGKLLHDMGVPFEKINRLFELGVEEFEGWDKGHIKGMTQVPEQLETESRNKIEVIEPDQKRIYTLKEYRADKNEKLQEEIKKTATRLSSVFETLLSDQKEAIFKDIEKNNGVNVKNIIDETDEDWISELNALYPSVGIRFGKKLIWEKRGVDEDLARAIDEYLEAETVVLTEKSLIARTTVNRVISQVNEGLVKGWNASKTQLAIIDSGVFEPARALRLSRTITGTAASLGQWKMGEVSGATHKKWNSATFEVRPEHAERNGEVVLMDQTFSPKFGMLVGPRFPLDNLLVPADRVNCRCSLSFEVR